jgi:hypothetical protein
VTGPDVSSYERLRALQGGLAPVRVALELAATRLGELERDLAEEVAQAPRPRGRPRLEKNPRNFLQEVRRLHEEEGLGRPAILAAMRDSGVTEWQVRQALAEIAGEKLPPGGGGVAR